jgi:hypothetical protein
MSRPSLSESNRRINAEIAQEKAAALGRAGERLEQALALVAALGWLLEAATDDVEQTRLRADYERARVSAGEARVALLIQREAVGLRHHRIVDQLFPEPPRRVAGRRPART